MRVGTTSTRAREDSPVNFHNLRVADAQLNGEIHVYASPHKDIILLRNYTFNKDTRLVHVHLQQPEHSMDQAAAYATFRGEFGDHFETDAIARGVLVCIDPATQPKESAWTRIRKSVGRWMRNVISGGRSVPPTRGSKATK